MAAAIVRQDGISRIGRHAEGGFTLIEVMISMCVLTVGLVSLLGVFGLAMANTQTSQQDLIAKQLANESLDSIFTARNSSQLTWAQIANVGTGSGIFLVGMQPIYKAGADGIYGTADDATAGEQTLQDPGPDGIFGTADDISIPLTGYHRQVLIQPVLDSNGNPISTLSSITITVQYSATQSGVTKTYVLNSYISPYR
jgi:prepilin-type N-terminal cleavage/methylation domain-containing protein